MRSKAMYGACIVMCANVLVFSYVDLLFGCFDDGSCRKDYNKCTSLPFFTLNTERAAVTFRNNVVSH